MANELDQLAQGDPTQAPPLPTTLSDAPENQPQEMQQAPTAQQSMAPAPDAAPVPFWKRILMGAFAGMANSAGAHNWGQALGQGAGGAMKQEQQVFQNQQAQQNQASQIKFRDAQDAYNAAMLHVQQGHLDLLKGKDRRDAQDDTDKRAAFLQSMGANVQPIPVGSAGSGPATAFLNQASTQPGGAEVNPWTLSGPDQMYAVSFDGEQGPVKRYQVYADTAKGFNLPVADRALVMGLNRQQQMQLEQLPSRYLNGSDENGKLYSKANEGQLRSAIETAQANIKQLSTDPEGNAQALANWQTRLVHLNSQMAGMNQAADAAAQRQAQVATARGKAMGDYRYSDYIDPQTGELHKGYNKDIAAAGAAPAASGMKAGAAQAQVNDIATGSQALRKAIQNVTPLSASQVAELSAVMNHDGEPTVRRDLLHSFLNKNVLTPQQKDFVVALNQQNERALSLRTVAGMGQASDQMRSAIRATLPSVASGDKQMMLKQLDAFDQQVNVLKQGMAKARGLSGDTDGAPARPAGVPANAKWDGATRTWHL